jgi:hypothetical protein
MKYCVLILALCFTLTAALAQQKSHSIITPKKVYIKYKGNAEKDSLEIPIVSDKYPALKAALAETVLFNGYTLDNIVEQYQKDGRGFTSLSYAVTYESPAVTSIVLSYETMDAHPDSYQLRLTLDIKTGNPYPLTNEIKPVGLNQIFKKYKAGLYKGLAATTKDVNRDKELDEEGKNYILRALKHSLDTLKPGDVFKNYSYGENGITVTSPDALPHAVRNYDLNRDWFIPYTKLRKYKTTTAKVIR